MSGIYLKSTKIHDIQGLCLPYNIVCVKIVRGQFSVLFVVPTSQKMWVSALNKMFKNKIKNLGILLWQHFLQCQNTCLCRVWSS